jgi:flagellar secretion chaperone FliS
MAHQPSGSAAAQQKYLETSIATASKEDLILKIFDALILASTQALEKLETERHDIEGIHKTLLRAQRACCLLMGSLDMNIGGEVATNLFRIYEFWHHELVMANMQKDAQRVARLMPYFKDFRATWGQAVAQFKAAQREVPGTTGRAIPPSAVSSFAAVG